MGVKQSLTNLLYVLDGMKQRLERGVIDATPGAALANTSKMRVVVPN